MKQFDRWLEAMLKVWPALEGESPFRQFLVWEILTEASRLTYKQIWEGDIPKHPPRQRVSWGDMDKVFKQ